MKSTISRRGWLAAAGALPGVFSAACTVPKKIRRPNILFAMADDQSWPHAGSYGGGQVSTPAFDRVAGEGALFANSFSACPSCTPSRSAILAGQHIWRLGAAGVLYGTIPPETPLFSHLLADDGYHVGYTGKGWVPGDWSAAGLSRNPLVSEYNSITADVVPPGIDPRDYSANFESFLADREEDQPFFFWFGAFEPHRIYGQGLGRDAGKDAAKVTVPAIWPDADLVRNDILDYFYEIEWFDQHLARMLTALEARGELENTIVVVTSDNGMPFPRAKVNLYDGGVRMPLAIRWGAEVAAGQSVDSLVSHTDFAPTFLEAAGLPIPEQMTGRSLLPMVRGDGYEERDAVFTALERHTWCRPEGATYPIRAVRTADHLYIRNFEPERWPTGGPDFTSSNKTPHGDVDGCPTKDFMLLPENRDRYREQHDLCFGKRPAEELYAVAGDPWQVDNLAADAEHAETKERLSARLEAELRATGDPRIAGEDPWQAYVYHQTIGYGATFNASLTEAERDAAAGRGAHKPE